MPARGNSTLSNARPRDFGSGSTRRCDKSYISRRFEFDCYRMVHRIPPRANSFSGAGERYCVICKEEGGNPTESARHVVTIKLRTGGNPRKVALCAMHFRGIGDPRSSYVLVPELTGAPRPRASAPTDTQKRGSRRKGEVNNSLRQLGRYSKTQRGRLGE
jgi:hypothetical protein